MTQYNVLPLSDTLPGFVPKGTDRTQPHVTDHSITDYYDDSDHRNLINKLTRAANESPTHAELMREAGYAINWLRIKVADLEDDHNLVCSELDYTRDEVEQERKQRTEDTDWYNAQLGESIHALSDINQRQLMLRKQNEMLLKQVELLQSKLMEKRPPPLIVKKTHRLSFPRRMFAKRT